MTSAALAFEPVQTRSLVSLTLPHNKGWIALPESFPLVHGNAVRRGRVAYQWVGDPKRPVVLAIGGISAGRYAWRANGRGWWQDFVGPGKAIDSDRFSILGFDFLGGAGDTSGLPEVAGGRASVDTRDQAELIVALLNSLGIESLVAAVGCSYGGMVALQLGRYHAHRVNRLALICAAHTNHQLGIAHRLIQRKVIELAAQHGETERGLAIARALAMTGYRGYEELEQRFAHQDHRRDASGFHFAVGDYLEARGLAFCERFTADAYLALSESIDLHQVEPEKVAVPAVAVATSSDRLVQPDMVRELSRRYAGDIAVHEIDSPYGHDGFLKQPREVRDILQPFLLGDS